MGYLDADGYLYIADRLKDMIISGGENIYPAEIENLINDIDGVTGVAVIGVPDDAMGRSAVGRAHRAARGIRHHRDRSGAPRREDRPLQAAQERRRRRRAAADGIREGAQGRPAGALRGLMPASAANCAAAGSSRASPNGPVDLERAIGRPIVVHEGAWQARVGPQQRQPVGDEHRPRGQRACPPPPRSAGSLHVSMNARCSSRIRSMSHAARTLSAIAYPGSSRAWKAVTAPGGQIGAQRLERRRQVDLAGREPEPVAQRREPLPRERGAQPVAQRALVLRHRERHERPPGAVRLERMRAANALGRLAQHRAALAR